MKDLRPAFMPDILRSHCVSTCVSFSLRLCSNRSHSDRSGVVSLLRFPRWLRRRSIRLSDLASAPEEPPLTRFDVDSVEGACWHEHSRSMSLRPGHWNCLLLERMQQLDVAHFPLLRRERDRVSFCGAGSAAQPLPMPAAGSNTAFTST